MLFNYDLCVKLIYLNKLKTVFKDTDLIISERTGQHFTDDQVVDPTG